MNFLLIEPNSGGHHMVLYTRLIVRGLYADGHKIQLLTTQSAIQHPAFRMVYEEAEGTVDIHLMSEIQPPTKFDAVSLLNYQYQFYKGLKSFFENFRPTQSPDFIYVVNFDYFDKVLAIFGSPFKNIPFGGMLMNIKHHRSATGIGPSSRSDKLYAFLFKRILRIPTLKSLAVIDECFIEYTKQNYIPEFDKIFFIPDVGSVSYKVPREVAREKLKIPQDSFVILVYGSLSLRKGIKELTFALQRIKNEKVTVLLAGQQDENVRHLLATPEAISLVQQGRILISDGFHDDHEEALVFGAADVSWLGYVGNFYGSSGVLLQSCSVGLPVLATDCGLIGWLTKENNLGLTINPCSLFAIAQAITKLSGDKKSYTNYSNNGLNFSKRYTLEEFIKYFHKMINDR